ncbi:MAG: NfeD family protein [Ruminococcaceae bacterium]|nr:NfeD family protein [Oscillospiraceae bacterium]
MMTYVWAAVIVAALLLEGVTFGLVAIWFVPGALVALIMSLFSVPLPWQILAFGVISVITLFLGLKIRRRKTKTNVDSLIGKTVLITEEVNNIEAKGTGKLNGQVWTVRAKNPAEALVPGDLAIVVAIEGVKLICRKK